jgi:hypothetical protein
MPAERVKQNRQDETVRQLRQFLESDLFNLGYDDVALLVDAQNIRRTLPGFQDKLIEQDTWRLTRDDEKIAIDELPGRLRVIRLRTARFNETPEWYPTEEMKPIASIQGVWTIPERDRCFYNTAKKPKTMAGVYKGKQQDPGEYYALPSMLEIFLAGLQKGDDPTLWAAMVDQWRRMGYLTDAMTLLPMPLQWATQADRYAEVIGPWVYPQEWAEVDVEDSEDEESDGSSPRVQQLALFDY